MNYIIDEKYHDVRLDRFLREQFSIPQSLVSKLIREKKVKINKQRAEISTKLQCGDTISIYYFLEKHTINVEIPSYITSLFQKWIIFEDSDLIIINKPEGFSSQGGTKSGFGVDEIAKSYNVEARITHRLDRGTSGIMVIAKGKPSARKITTLFAEGMVKKKYLAVVENGIQNNGMVEGNLIKDVLFQKMTIKNNELQNGNSSVKTLYNTLDTKNYTLLEVLPQTGKMHQIRAHLASIGFPILGDEKYQGKSFSRMMLHAQMVEFLGHTHTAAIPQQFLEEFPSLIIK